MSLEVFGDEGDGFDVEVLYARGWASDPDCVKWWRMGEEENVYTLDEAIEAYESWISDWMEDE